MSKLHLRGGEQSKDAEPKAIGRDKLLEEISKAEQQLAQHSNLAVQYQGAILAYRHLLSELEPSPPASTNGSADANGAQAKSASGDGPLPDGQSAPQDSAAPKN